MPEEDFYYFGDSRNAPYGTKSTEKVRELTIAHTEDFMKMGAKGVGDRPQYGYQCGGARLAPHVPGTAAGRDRAGGQTGSRKVSSRAISL